MATLPILEYRCPPQPLPEPPEPTFLVHASALIALIAGVGVTATMPASQLPSANDPDTQVFIACGWLLLGISVLVLAALAYFFHSPVASLILAVIFLFFTGLLLRALIPFPMNPAFVLIACLPFVAIGACITASVTYLAWARRLRCWRRSTQTQTRL